MNYSFRKYLPFVLHWIGLLFMFESANNQTKNHCFLILVTFLKFSVQESSWLNNELFISQIFAICPALNWIIIHVRKRKNNQTKNHCFIILVTFLKFSVKESSWLNNELFISQIFAIYPALNWIIIHVRKRKQPNQKPLKLLVLSTQ